MRVTPDLPQRLAVMLSHRERGGAVAAVQAAERAARFHDQPARARLLLAVEREVQRLADGRGRLLDIRV
jgi:hypothetical protein